MSILLPFNLPGMEICNLHQERTNTREELINLKLDVISSVASRLFIVERFVIEILDESLIIENQAIAVQARQR